MEIYTLKVALRGVSPMVWRRLRLHKDTSLASLHCILQLCFGWDDDHLHQFHIYGKDYGINKVGAERFSDNVYQITIKDFEFDVGDRFTYEYNFYENWVFNIRIEAIEKLSPRKKTPFCLSGKGMPGATEYDVYEKTIQLLEMIVDEDATLTVGDVRQRIEALDEVRFNHKKANGDILQLNPKDPFIEQVIYIG